MAIDVRRMCCVWSWLVLIDIHWLADSDPLIGACFRHTFFSPWCFHCSWSWEGMVLHKKKHVRDPEYLNQVDSFVSTFKWPRFYLRSETGNWQVFHLTNFDLGRKVRMDGWDITECKNLAVASPTFGCLVRATTNKTRSKSLVLRMQKLIKRNINLQRCQTKSAPGNHKQLNLAPILSQLSFTQIMSAVTQRACGQVTRDLHVTWAAQILQQAQKKKGRRSHETTTSR